MDLEWLLPEQIDQILKFCELSSVEDLSFAANILETNHWDLENALHDVVNQNDQIKKRELRKNNNTINKATNNLQDQEYQPSTLANNIHQQDKFQIHSGDYQQLVSQTNLNYKIDHSSILAQQNYQYQQMVKKMTQQKQQSQIWETMTKLREAQFAQGKKQFENRVVADPLTIKFRLAHCTTQYAFSFKDKIQTIFNYVNFCLRDNLQNRYAEFELTQNYSTLKLSEKRQLTLAEVFGESSGEVIIVKELD